MRSLGKVFEWILNISSLFIAALLLSFVVRHYLTHSAEGGSVLGPPEGSSLSLTDTNWAANRFTLVLALQVGCKWCEASADFYRDLVRSSSNDTFHAVAVIPGTESQGRAFMRSLNVDISEIHHADLQTLGIQATPTLVLVNNRGRVESSWVGKLSPDQEEKVFKKLGVMRPPRTSVGEEGQYYEKNSAGSSAKVITAAQLIQLQKTVGDVPIIDVRARSDYKKGHISGSLSIPQEELEARAQHEVPEDATVVIYCHYCQPCESSQRSKGIGTLCTVGEAWLQKLGYTNVKVLGADLSLLQLAGVKIIGVPQERAVSGSTPVHGYF